MSIATANIYSICFGALQGLRAGRSATILTNYRPAMPFGERKINFRGSFQFCIVTIKKYHPSGNLNFNYLGNSKSLKLLRLMEKSFNFSQAEFHS